MLATAGTKLKLPLLINKCGYWWWKGRYPLQCPTGTRYPTRTRSFFQYPIRTRFVFKIIGYFGYRVFQKTMFLTWKTASRSYKILTIEYHLLSSLFDYTDHYFDVLWANFNRTLLHNCVILVFQWVLLMLLHQIVSRLSTMEEYHWRKWDQLVHKGVKEM